MKIIGNLLAFFVFYFLGFISLYNLLSHPFGLISVLYFLGSVVFAIVGFIFMWQFIRSLSVISYNQFNKFIVENNLHQTDLLLRHENNYVNSPKRLISMTYEGKEYFTDICDILTISSIHEGYLYLINEKTIVIVHDSGNHTWASYTN